MGVGDRGRFSLVERCGVWQASLLAGSVDCCGIVSGIGVVGGAGCGGGCGIGGDIGGIGGIGCGVGRSNGGGIGGIGRVGCGIGRSVGRIGGGGIGGGQQVVRGYRPAVQVSAHQRNRAARFIARRKVQHGLGLLDRRSRVHLRPVVG